MNPVKLLITVVFLLPLYAIADTGTQTAEQIEQQKYIEWARGIWNSLDRQTGEVKLEKASATLNIPENFYFLNVEDSEKILVDVWGNPAGEQVLGMLFPSESTPFDEDSWAVTIRYEEDGYVSDEDANHIDYSDLLEDMQKDTKALNKERVQNGYAPIELVGWASPPYYDASSHKLHWAKELKFGDRPVNILNYNIRILGKKGVLILNFIADINQKQLIEDNLSSVLSLAEFDQGSLYADFDPEYDKVAAYGIGALVAGKVIAKTGFLAAGLIFLKKFGVIFLLGFAAFFKRVFGKNKVKNSD